MVAIPPLDSSLAGMPAEAPWSWVPASWSMPEQPVPDPAGPQPAGAPEIAAPVQTVAPATAPAQDLAAAPIAPPLGPEPGIQLPFAAPPPITELPSAKPAAPDAVSTAEGMKPKGEVAGESYAPTRAPEQLPEAHYRESAKKLAESPFDPATGGIRADVSDEEVQQWMDELAQRDPATFAVIQQKLIDTQARNIATERARIAEENHKREQANLKARTDAINAAQAKSAAIEADAQRIAATKIDPTGGLSGGQSIAGVLGAIIGGLVQGRTGSARNAGMDALNDIINRSIEAQKANLANQREGVAGRRTALAEEYARTGDMFHAQEAVRLAALKHADDVLAADQQKFSPRGITFARHANMRAQIGAAQAEAHRKIFNDETERGLKISKQLLDEAQLRQKAANDRATIGLGYAKIKSEQDERKQAREFREQDKAAERADKAAERQRQFAIGGIPKIQTDADGKPVLGPDGKPVVAYDVLRNQDGSAWEAESPEATRDLRQQKTSASQVISIIDEIRAIRSRVGGESKLLNSNDSQRLEVLKAKAKLLTKQGTQGMSSDEDMETLEDAAGTSSADSWRDQEGKLTEARGRVESALNQAFRDAKYTGPAITFPEAKPAQETPEEIHAQRLFEKPDESIDQARRDIEEARAEGFADVGRDTGASIWQQKEIAKLGLASRGTGADADSARALLGRLSEEAHTTKLRSLAQRALQEANMAGMASPEQTTTATDTPARRRSGPASVAEPPVAVPRELGGR